VKPLQELSLAQLTIDPGLPDRLASVKVRFNSTKLGRTLAGSATKVSEMTYSILCRVHGT